MSRELLMGHAQPTRFGRLRRRVRRRSDDAEIFRDFERRRTYKRRGVRATGQRGHLFRCPERRQLRPADQGGASGGVNEQRVRTLS